MRRRGKSKRKKKRFSISCSVAIIRSKLTGSYLFVWYGFPLQNSKSWTTWLSTDLKNLGIKTPFAWLFSNEVQLKCIFKSETTAEATNGLKKLVLTTLFPTEVVLCAVCMLLFCFFIFYFAAIADAGADAFSLFISQFLVEPQGSLSVSIKLTHEHTYSRSKKENRNATLN